MHYLKGCVARGKPCTLTKKRPQLNLVEQYYFQTYSILLMDAPVVSTGMGAFRGGIPLSTILKWCEVRGVSSLVEIGRMVQVIQFLDIKRQELEGKSGRKDRHSDKR